MDINELDKIFRYELEKLEQILVLHENKPNYYLITDKLNNIVGEKMVGELFYNGVLRFSFHGYRRYRIRVLLLKHCYVDKQVHIREKILLNDLRKFNSLFKI